MVPEDPGSIPLGGESIFGRDYVNIKCAVLGISTLIQGEPSPVQVKEPASEIISP